MRRKQAKQKRRDKMKHRKKILSQKGENKRSMLKGREIVSCVAQGVLCQLTIAISIMK